MLQYVATLSSLLIAGGMIAMIVAMLTDEWALVVRALRLRQPFRAAPLPMRGRSAVGQRRARVICVNSQFAPRSAAA